MNPSTSVSLFSGTCQPPHSHIRSPLIMCCVRRACLFNNQSLKIRRGVHMRLFTRSTSHSFKLPTPLSVLRFVFQIISLVLRAPLASTPQEKHPLSYHRKEKGLHHKDGLLTCTALRSDTEEMTSNTKCNEIPGTYLCMQVDVRLP